MNRRVFIFTAGGTLAAQTLPSKQVVVGLIGAGARGSELLRACLADSSIRVGAVCETFEPRMFAAVAAARSAGHRTRYYRLSNDVLADKDVDAVIIATPDFSHCRLTLAAIRAGKDVYVEQPLSLTWEEAVQMARAERETRQILQVGSQARSGRSIAAADRSQLSRPRAIQAWSSSDYLRPGVLRRGGFKLSDPLNFVDWQVGASAQEPYSPDRFLNWRFISMYSGGPVTDLGCPMLDTIHALTGVGFPTSVTAEGVRSREEGFDIAERAVITVKYPATSATISIDGAASRIDQHWSIDGAAGPPLRPAEPETTQRHLANFVEAVRTRRPPNATVAQTLAATLIGQMANLSIVAGRTVHWDGTRSRVEGP